MAFDCTYPRLVQLRQDYDTLFQDQDTGAPVTTLPELLQQPRKPLATFIAACFAAGDYEDRNLPSRRAMRAAWTAAREAARAREAAAAAIPRRRSPRLNAQH